MSAVSARTQQQQRFLRRTTLKPDEYNRNFRMLDHDTLGVLTSPEADAVTPLMSKVYLRLLQTPDSCRQGERELHFEGEVREGKRTKAWDQLCRHLRVSSETAQKALHWMHGQGIIGYSAFKNRVGIFIFLNRASSSIGVRRPNGDKNFLNFPPASEGDRPASPSAPAFNDPSGDLENSDTDLIRRAPKNGAKAKPMVGNSSDPAPGPTNNLQNGVPPDGREVPSVNSIPERSDAVVPVNEIVRQLRSVLEPTIKSVAIQVAQREHERTREWLERSGIPKAVRVAQRESYGVLRAHGLVEGKKGGAKFRDDVGRSFSHAASGATREPFAAGVSSATISPTTTTTTTAAAAAATPTKRLSDAELRDVAEACFALLKTQGRSMAETVQELTAGASVSHANKRGGWLTTEDAARVLVLAEEFLEREEEEGGDNSMAKVCH